MTDKLKTVANNLISMAKECENKATRSSSPHILYANTLRMVANCIDEAVENDEAKSEIERLQGWLDRFIEVGDRLHGDLDAGLLRYENLRAWEVLKQSYDVYK